MINIEDFKKFCDETEMVVPAIIPDEKTFAIYKQAWETFGLTGGYLVQYVVHAVAMERVLNAHAISKKTERLKWLELKEKYKE